MIKTRSEAGRSTGTVKRKGSLAKMTNFGYYLDDDKAFIQRCDEALANAEVSEDLAEKIKAAKEALEKEMEIEPADMRGALNRLHSPLAKDDAEKEKIFKDSRSAVFLVRKAIYDEKLNGMVNTLTSKYASNAKRTLEDGIHTIEVTKTEMEKLGITGDDVTAGLYSATTLTQSQKSKAVAEFIVKMRPQLEKAIAAVKAADAILSSDLNAILLEMKDMFDEAQKDAESLKTTVRTTVAAADKGDLEAIPLPDSLGESVRNEGIFSKLANWFSKVASKIRGFVDGILGLADDANDEVDHLMGLLEGVEESCKGEDRHLPLEAAILDIFRLLKGKGYSTRSVNSWIDANMRRIQDLLDANYDSAEDIVREIDDPSPKQRGAGKAEGSSDPMVIYKDGGIYRTTPKSNYDARIQNAHRIQTWNGFDTPQEIIDYCKKYTRNFDPENVIIVETKSESKGIEQVRKELNDIADLWVGNDYGDDKERALADACTAVEGTEWEDAACAILKDSDLMARLTVAEAIELILSELPEA